MDLEKYVGMPEEPFRTSDVKIDDKEKKLVGTGIQEGEVFRVDAYLEGGRNNHKLSLVEKRFYYQDPPGEMGIPKNIFEILEKQKKLKELNFPVIPTMRWSPQKPGSLFLTDLTEKGKNEVVSSNDFGKLVLREEKFEIGNPEEILKQLIKIFFLCLNSGVYPGATDVLFLKINKQNYESEIIFGDLGEVQIKGQPFTTKLEFESLKVLFLKYIDNINYFLKKTCQISADSFEKNLK